MHSFEASEYMCAVFRIKSMSASSPHATLRPQTRVLLSLSLCGANSIQWVRCDRHPVVVLVFDIVYAPLP